jgi:dihydropteroate synthase
MVLIHKTYIRPTGIVYGPDASTLSKEGKAGALGGLPHIAFTQAEVIKRVGREVVRQIVDYAALRNDLDLDAIESPRPAIAGLDMQSAKFMGIVNVTPDSFSDGGKFDTSERAIIHGKRLQADGADILDIGGESTRPGSEAVETAEEIARVIPVIEGLNQTAVVSADTRKAAVMRAAAEAGAKIVNDVSALSFDAGAAQRVATLNLPVVLMHAQGEPRTMQLNPRYEDVALDVYDMLEQRIAAALAAGITRSNIVIDPGIGFGKSFQHNLDIMRQLTLFHGLGVALLVGLSRKGYVGALTHESLAANRMAGSVGGALHAIMNGAHILRVHDVKETVQAAKVFTCGLTPDLAEL